jgi:hypothetical protein
MSQSTREHRARSAASEAGAAERLPLSAEELESLEARELQDREAMSVIDPTRILAPHPGSVPGPASGPPSKIA